MAAHSCARPFRFLSQLFVINGQSRQTVQLQPGGMARDVLIVALSRDHRAVVAAEFQLGQVDPGPQLLGAVVDQLAQTAIGRDAARQTDLLCATGRREAFGSPVLAALATLGPPGEGRPSVRATLSKASPAASSTVWPRMW